MSFQILVLRNALENSNPFVPQMAKPITTCAFLKWINANLLLGMVSNKMAIATIFGHKQSIGLGPIYLQNTLLKPRFKNTVSI